MKIKRYIDTDMRQVLRRVRQDQGPDAVILSNRRVEGGIEVITAVDYDEALMQQALGPVPGLPAEGGGGSGGNAVGSGGGSRSEASIARTPARLSQRAVSAEADTAVETGAFALANVSGDAQSLDGLRSELSSLRALLETQVSGLLWQDNARRSPLRAQVLRNLARIGVAPDVANIVVNRLEPIDNIKALWRQPLVMLAQAIPVVGDALLVDGGIAALVGPTGVGKTTTIAKIAARHVMRHGTDDIALVCADAWRIGAREHLEAFGNIIGIKVHAASDTNELNAILDRLQAKKLVLIDTEGLSQRDRDLSRRLAEWRDNEARVRFYLTLSAASQEAGLDETIRQFESLPMAGAVITKIDEAAQLGCVISALIRHELKAAWLSDGQRIPDDLHLAEKKKLWLVNQAVECLDRGEQRIDERTMAENYGRVSMANA
ncbi:MAG TPA: flagellar biosynthesis protein FlhF [Woeseiaceae bacterium]|nr:flagellar biosynthesis protein FlhF [Woeseiaceae bacterium]